MRRRPRTAPLPTTAACAQALTHLAKCFDCAPAQRTEVDALALALNGNMALAYQKLENWDKVTHVPARRARTA